MASSSGPTTRISVEYGSEARPALIRWSTWVPSKSGRGGQCYDAYCVMAPEGPVLIDPVDPGEAALDRLRGMIGSEPVAAVLTSAWHERDAYRARGEWGTPVWAPQAGTAELEGKPSHLYVGGATLPGGLRAVMVDERFAGDSVLLWAASPGERVLFSGDAVLAELNPWDPRPEHWRREPGLYLFLHGPGDVARFRRSFGPLLDEEFDVICSAHSVVVRENSSSGPGMTPKEALRRLLEEGQVIERPMGYGTAVGLAMPRRG